MSSNAKGKDSTAPNFTARDLELAGLVWRAFKTEPQVDYAVLAELAGFKNAQTASACWGPVKKKLMGNATPSTPKASRTSTPKATPKPKASKKSKASEVTADDDDEENVTPKPMKVDDLKKKGGTGKKRGAKEMNGDEEDNDESAEKKVKAEFDFDLNFEEVGAEA